jgi:tetraacyldisaccharide 4'-kinase
VNYLRWLLAPIAPLYWLIVYIRNWAFNKRIKHIAEVPTLVISVGNLTTGGTGKTPIVLYLAEAMEQAGIHVNIISRGYGGHQDFGSMIVQPSSNYIQSGDEPLMIAQKLGVNRVVVGHKRYNAAKLALSLEPRPNALLMDDGFQHRGLKRNFDILLLDGIRRWGNGLMLPIGDLREPMSGAARASCLVVTRSNKASQNKIMTWWKQWGSGGPIFWIDFAIHSLRNFKNAEKVAIKTDLRALGSLFAFCAIGHPEAFFADLTAAGITIVGTKHFRDHKLITNNNLMQVQSMATAAGASGLVCTEKDAVKLNDIIPVTIPLWIAEQQVVGGESMLDWTMQQAATYLN